MKVTQMKSPRTGKPVPNQYVIQHEDREVFQSYNTTICVRYNDGTVVLDETSWDCSNTTRKYRSEFLQESTVITRKKLGCGEYTTADLN